MIHLIRQGDYPNTCFSLEEGQCQGQEGTNINAIMDNLQEGTVVQIPMSQLPSPICRSVLTNMFALPEDAIIKLHFEGKLIPWSMVEKCNLVEIRVCRPHQNVKPHISEGSSTSDVLVRKKIKELEVRLASLEAVSDPATISAKTDRDLQLLTKQIAFLGKRLDEADSAEWIKKS